MSSLIKYKLLPEDTDKQIMARRVFEFNRYLKTVCKDTASFYKLDMRAINFLVEIGEDNLISSFAFKLIILSSTDSVVISSLSFFVNALMLL